MNAEGLTDWFTKLFQSLEEPSVIIMNNAPHRSQQISRAPTSAYKKSEIQEWLRQHGIEFSDSELKPELLQMVQRNRPEKIYKLDQLALESRHEVIRLPPANITQLSWYGLKQKMKLPPKTALLKLQTSKCYYMKQFQTFRKRTVKIV
ncbi:unnamed protein product [Parnassius mnemosyne]|uniref:Transposase n=1 Tax=Parnassius mnemosyne TaxID=213953 RepID=A0AAV1M6J6_9NEOP